MAPRYLDVPSLRPPRRANPTQPGRTQDWIKLGGKVRSDRPEPLKKSIAEPNRAGG
jgi:hypothetical protein